MGIVFDEVVADVRPDREESADGARPQVAKKGPSVEEIVVAVERRKRLARRLEAR